MRTRFVGHLSNRIDTHSLYWQWKTLKIDFGKFQNMNDENNSWCWPKGTDRRDRYNGDGYKLKYALRYVGTPVEGLSQWYNGGFSSEYNTALNYLLELDLIEITRDELDDEDSHKED